eukprot:5961022-Prorocentrum_lima.AAC.1
MPVYCGVYGGKSLPSAITLNSESVYSDWIACNIIGRRLQCFQSGNYPFVEEIVESRFPI